MSTQKYKFRLTPEQTLTHLTTIASGLLANGGVEGIDVVASGVLRKLIARVEDEINDSDASCYIDEGYERPILPGSDRDQREKMLDRRKKWLANPVTKKP